MASGDQQKYEHIVCNVFFLRINDICTSLFPPPPPPSSSSSSKRPGPPQHPLRAVGPEPVEGEEGGAVGHGSVGEALLVLITEKKRRRFLANWIAMTSALNVREVIVQQFIERFLSLRLRSIHIRSLAQNP